MGVVALITWLCTAGGGLYLLAVWLIEYDREFQTAARTRLPVPVISSHALLAVLGVVLWSSFLLTDDMSLAWGAVAVLGCVGVLGVTMAARWLRVYREALAQPAGAPAPIAPPERNFPVPVVIGHGTLALTTMILVVVTVLRAI